MNEKINLTGRQLAAARVLLGKSQAEIAALAHISTPTLRRMESTSDDVQGYPNNILAVRNVLEEAGVMFIDPADHGAGVRLKKA